MIICGIDPGFSGAMAMISDVNNEVVWDRIPSVSYNTTKDNKERITLDTGKFYETLRLYNVDVVYMELIYPMQSWSSLSQFSFGICYGGLLTALHSWGKPFDLVSPKTWQSGIGIHPKRGKHAIEMGLKVDVKLMVAEYIKKVYPNQKFVFGRERRTNHNVTDAVGIARYGLMKIKEMEKEIRFL